MADEIPQVQKANSFVESIVLLLNQRLTATEDNLQKITTIVNQVVNDQAVSEYKTDQNIRVSSKVEKLIDQARNEINNHRAKISSDLLELQTELSTNLSDYRSIIDRKIADCEKHISTANANNAEITRLQATVNNLKDTDISKLREDVDFLRKALWTALGGGAVLIFIVQALIAFL